MVDNKIFERLERSIDQDEFLSVAYEVENEMLSSEKPIEYVKPILDFIEKHPSSFFGEPGALIHFVEKFAEQGYEELLIESVKRCPTFYNLWMMNRAINDPKDKRHSIYIEIFNALLEQNSVSDEIKDIIRDFLS